MFRDDFIHDAVGFRLLRGHDEIAFYVQFNFFDRLSASLRGCRSTLTDRRAHRSSRSGERYADVAAVKVSLE